MDHEKVGSMVVERGYGTKPGNPARFFVSDVDKPLCPYLFIYFLLTGSCGAYMKGWLDIDSQMRYPEIGFQMSL